MLNYEAYVSKLQASKLLLLIQQKKFIQSKRDK